MCSDAAASAARKSDSQNIVKNGRIAVVKNDLLKWADDDETT